MEDHSNAQGSVSPLRQRMLEDMTIRGFGEQTKRDYVRQVRMFAAFIDRKPAPAEPEDLRRYQLHMAASGASASTMNQACAALRFFFHVTLGRPGFGDRMARISTPERLPVVLSPEEVALLLAHASNLKHRAALSVAYGLRPARFRIANLKVSDIDSARMLIRVEQGKGRKDRYVMLSPDLLALLRQWWREKRSKGWLFPRQQPGQPITSASSAAPALPPPASAGSASASPCTRCGTASPRIFWSRRSISASSRRCSATGSSTQRRSTRCPQDDPRRREPARCSRPAA